MRETGWAPLQAFEALPLLLLEPDALADVEGHTHGAGAVVIAGGQW